LKIVAASFVFEKAGSTMKKKISILTAAIAILGMSQYPASASLLGMPLNLKTAIASRDTQKPAWQFYSDDIFVVPVLI
jgi:hypothetical protein